DVLLQPLDLLADGRLRAMDALAGAGEPAGIDHGDEAAQEFEIEHGDAPFVNPLEGSLSFNFQMRRRKPRSGGKGAHHVARALRRGSPRPIQLAAVSDRPVLPDLELCLRGGGDWRY